MPGRIETAIVVERVRSESITIGLLGTTPFVANRMSEKAKRQLLNPPPGRKTLAEKQATLKHDPLAEYRASPYTLPGGETLLAVPSTAVKGAMMTAALDLPGTRKAQIGRLVYVEGDLVPLYGGQQLFMSVTRSADIKHTPDIRTRAILPEWAVVVTVKYVAPILNATAIINLLDAGGKTAGLGDWRPEKGHGNYGMYDVVDEDDPRLAYLREHAGRAVQEAAMETAVCYDQETAELLAWWQDQAARRGKT